MTDPRKLGKYEIRAELGRGAMGVVYEAFDPLIERRVAIKTIRTDVYDGSNLEAMLQRFEHEAKAAGRLNHPRVVTIYDYGRDGEAAYIVMELVDCKTLSSLFERHTQFMLTDTVRIVSQILDALEHAHRNGVIHRDIKPANILVLPSGDIKVADFGIARLELSTLTQTGSQLGTPLCMSPEQFLGKEVDCRSDIFSVGVILYELLTGERPFPGSSLTTIMHQVLKVDPPLPTELNLTLPPALDAVVRKAIAKRPDDRYPSAELFSRALQLAAQQQQPAVLTTQQDSPDTPQETSLGFDYRLTESNPSSMEGNASIDPTVVLERTANAHSIPPPAVINSPARRKAAVTKPSVKPGRWLWSMFALLAVASLILFLREPAPPVAPLQAQRPLQPFPHAPESVPAINETALELAFWDSIKNSTDERDFKAYLHKYPSGEFSGLAHNRLAQLKPEHMPSENRSQPKTGEEKQLEKLPRNAGEFQRLPVENLMQRARDGHDMAMNNLGMLYRDGRGVPQSDTQAVDWFRKAAEKNNPKAMANLAFMYFKGRGVSRDENEGRKLMQRAAELGDERARDWTTREDGFPVRHRPRPVLP